MNTTNAGMSQGRTGPAAGQFCLDKDLLPEDTVRGKKNVISALYH